VTTPNETFLLIYNELDSTSSFASLIASFDDKCRKAARNNADCLIKIRFFRTPHRKREMDSEIEEDGERFVRNGKRGSSNGRQREGEREKVRVA